MEITERDLLEEASALALEVRMKDRLIARLQARVAELERAATDDNALQSTIAGR